MILVDTSAWIDFLRRRDSSCRSRLVQLLQRGEAALVDPVVAELLYGVRGDRERAMVLDLGRGAHRLELAPSTWRAAARCGCRSASSSRLR